MLDNVLQLSSSPIRTTTYGPDGPNINALITVTFDLEGPLLIEPFLYHGRGQIVAINDMMPVNPMVDEFTLYEKLGYLLGL